MSTKLVEKALLQFVTKDKALQLKWQDGTSSTFHYIWLRDNCPSFKDPHSGQRKINIIDNPLEVYPRSVEINDDNQLHIVWQHDSHHSQFDLDWLRKYSYSNGEGTKRKNPSYWDGSFDMRLCQADYRQVLEDLDVQRKWLQAFKDYGFGMLRNVPTQPRKVLEVANQLSYVIPVTWGNFFEVDGVVAVDNYFGNSTGKLYPHIDEPSFDPIPTISSLHCFVNDAEGGMSTMADGFKVADALRNQAPEQFKLLSNSPVKFCFYSNDLLFEHETPIIRLNVLGEMEQVVLNNTSIQPFQFPLEMMELYYEAYRNFFTMASSPEFQVKYKLKSGDLTLYDNHRILHARTAYSSQGQRRLEGCYIGRDGLYSRLAMLNNQQS